MRLTLVILVFLGFAIAIGGGIVRLMYGSPWLLLAVLAALVWAFIKLGCRPR